MLSEENFAHTKAVIDKMLTRIGEIIGEVDETVRDRARLEREAIEREHVIDQLNALIASQSDRIKQLEDRNAALAEDVVRVESELAAQTAILDNVRNLTAPPAPSTTRAA